jgi:hypothetical protein
MVSVRDDVLLGCEQVLNGVRTVDCVFAGGTVLDWQASGFTFGYSKRALWTATPEKSCRALMNLEKLTDARSLGPWTLVIVDVYIAYEVSKSILHLFNLVLP